MDFHVRLLIKKNLLLLEISIIDHLSESNNETLLFGNEKKFQNTFTRYLFTLWNCENYHYFYSKEEKTATIIIISFPPTISMKMRWIFRIEIS